MKIKQVIAETGLTDRAIRLYIENDLVKPECDENYNGRKSIDFSETDVANFKILPYFVKQIFQFRKSELCKWVANLHNKQLKIT